MPGAPQGVPSPLLSWNSIFFPHGTPRTVTTRFSVPSFETLPIGNPGASQPGCDSKHVSLSRFLKPPLYVSPPSRPWTPTKLYYFPSLVTPCPPSHFPPLPIDGFQNFTVHKRRPPFCGFPRFVPFSLVTAESLIKPQPVTPRPPQLRAWLTFWMPFLRIPVEPIPSPV